MRIEEYIGTLPQEIMSGDSVRPTHDSIRRMLSLAGTKKGDTVYHLGCGDESGVRIAIQEFGARAAVGIDKDKEKADSARVALNGIPNHEIICADVIDADLSKADVILFWFADEDTVETMLDRFESLRDGVRVVTVWGAPPGCLPEKVDFPFVLSVTPFKKASSVREQLMAVLGVRCIDFVTAWEFSERYTRAIEPDSVDNNRLLTIIQAVTMWINARNLGVACTKEMPESIKTYVGILRMFYGIETEHLLDER